MRPCTGCRPKKSSQKLIIYWTKIPAFSLTKMNQAEKRCSKICTPQMIVWSGVTFILKCSCFFFWPGQNCCFSHRARKICMDFGPINLNFFCGQPADSFFYNAKSTWRNAGDESERYHVTNFKIFSVGVIQRFQRAAAKIVNIDCYTTVRSILRPITINRKNWHICVWINSSLL